MPSSPSGPGAGEEESASEIKILFIGDVIGRSGRRAVLLTLPDLRRRRSIDLVVANGENLAGGFGLTEETATEVFDAGVDCITSGNHLWDRRDSISFIKREERILRPANYPDGAPGAVSATYELRGGARAAVVDLQGRVFMQNIDCPFRTAERLVSDLRREASIILVEVHAEATSEKMALGWFMDGKATAVVGTHTHVQTADERILPGGTAYITDIGMTGGFDSVIGMQKQGAIERFLTHIPVRLEPSRGDVRLQGVLIEADAGSGRAKSIERVEVTVGGKA